MLSEETAVGKYPVEAVRLMRRIVSRSEKHLRHETNSLRLAGG
jgi:pyruvate kinase